MFYPLNLQMFAEGDPDPQGEKTFTQADVDRIVGERLGRESIQDMKEIVSTLQELGYQGTPAEIKAEVKRLAEETKAQKALEDAKAEAQRTGTSPELAAEMKQLKQEIAELKQERQESKKQTEAQKAAQEKNKQDIADFKVKHPDVDFDQLLKNQKFGKFLDRAHPSLPLAEVYEDFKELVGETEAVAIAKITANTARTTASGKGGGEATGGAYGLNARQQELAKENGMTNKEYAELLGHVRK